MASLLCGVIMLNRLIMKIDNTLLDELTAQAKASPRLRMNMDLRNSAADTIKDANWGCGVRFYDYTIY